MSSRKLTLEHIAKPTNIKEVQGQLDAGMVQLGSVNSRLKVRTIVQNVTVIVLLKLTDTLMSPYFTCPCTNLRSLLVGLYFTGPSLAFTALTISLSKRGVFEALGCGGCCKGGAGYGRSCTSPALCSLWRKSIVSLYPAMCWVTILFIDGKYYACLHLGTCSNITAGDMKSPEGIKLQVESQILGFGLVVLVSILSLCFYLYECLCSSPEDRYRKLFNKKLEKAKELHIKEYVKKRCVETLSQCDSLLSPHPHRQPDVLSVVEIACSAVFTSETKLNLPFTKALSLTLIRNPLPSIKIAFCASSLRITKPLSDPESRVPLQTASCMNTLSLPVNQPLSPTLSLTEFSGESTLILTLIPEAVIAVPLTFNKPAIYSLTVSSGPKLQLISSTIISLPNHVHSVTLPLPFKQPQPLTLVSCNDDSLTLSPNTVPHHFTK
ncbi:hypothetical protein JZ751_026312 [Albula glossodonta]|uniref:Uncharacterized protein n=1 Tax=Albula glossodonta TaxID=121402 RepID=A0A8T2PCL6_9TELE|nr:hypothetical protein JZ751_026312 [Albula glossodonta]